MKGMHADGVLALVSLAPLHFTEGRSVMLLFIIVDVCIATFKGFESTMTAIASRIALKSSSGHVNCFSF